MSHKYDNQNIVCISEICGLNIIYNRSVMLSFDFFRQIGIIVLYKYNKNCGQYVYRNEYR